MITKRQKKILESVVREHVKTAEPVGSEIIANRYNLKCSPATIRNEMLELDRFEYLFQPHTSAGRIPTEKAYKMLAVNIKPRSLSANQERAINKSYDPIDRSSREGIKSLARTLSDLTKEFILTAFSDNDFYYTGLSNLFSKPEFRNQNIICNVSCIIDQLDLRLSKLYKTSQYKPKIYIGSSNPIDPYLSFISVKIKQCLDGSDILLGVLGPMRMKYSLNLSLLNYCIKLISKKDV